MEVNINESISSLFDSLDEWLNDENRIVRMIYIHYVVNQLISHSVYGPYKPRTATPAGYEPCTRKVFW